MSRGKGWVGLAAIAVAAALVSTQPAAAAVCSGPNAYPGDAAPRTELARWMARGARDRAIPPELPVMGALVESDLRNIDYGDAGAGFFAMRRSIWDQGQYAGYSERPELQLQWFIDQAMLVRDRAIAAGDAGFGTNESLWGEWAADVLRPAEQYRYRYQLRLGESRQLIGELCTNPAEPPPSGPPDTRFEKVPKNRLSASKATYRFTSTEPGSSFVCKLDEHRFKPCASPKTLKRLERGKHRFRVAAVGADGDRDPTPAADGFKRL